MTLSAIAAPTPIPEHVPAPPLMPQRKQWRDLVLDNSSYENTDVVAAVPVDEINVRQYGT